MYIKKLNHKGIQKHGQKELNDYLISSFLKENRAPWLYC